MKHEMQHNPEPWNDACLGEVRDEFGRIIAVTRSQKPILHADKTNAARIVACVNGCEGIADPSAVKYILAAAADLLGYADGWAEQDAETPEEKQEQADLARTIADLRAALAKANRRTTA